MAGQPVKSDSRTAVAEATRFSDLIREHLRSRSGAETLAPLAVLVGIVAIISIFHPRFLSHQAIINNIQVAGFVAIVAYGMVYLMAMAEVDLSVGGTYGLAVIVSGRLMSETGMDPYVAGTVAICCGVLLGAFNGLLANAFGAGILIVSLGTFALYRGLVSVVSRGDNLVSLPTEHSFFSTLGGKALGIPVVGWIAVVLGVLLHVVLMKSRFGAMVRAVGSNREAAEFSGIPVGRIRLWCAMLTGGLAGLAGVLALAYFAGGDPAVGQGVELQVIAAAIIGGTGIAGGSGSVLGGLVGSLIIVVIGSGLVFFRVDPLWGNVVTGAVIIVAIGFDALARTRRQARAARAL